MFRTIQGGIILNLAVLPYNKLMREDSNKKERERERERGRERERSSHRTLKQTIVLKADNVICAATSSK